MKPDEEEPDAHDETRCSKCGATLLGLDYCPKCGHAAHLYRAKGAEREADAVDFMSRAPGRRLRDFLSEPGNRIDWENTEDAGD